MSGGLRQPEGRIPVNIQASLWRSIAVFRVASLIYAAVLIVVDRANYSHVGWAWAVLAGMAVWTAVTSAAYAVPARRGRPLLAADLVVTAAALASTALVQYPSAVAEAAMPVTATWVAGPVLAWAVAGGIRAGVVAALVLGVCDLTLRHQSLAGAYRSPALNGTVLLLLAGVVVGYVSTLAAQAERAVLRATEIEAASRERERLARGIHDSVLQVLALVQRRGAEVGGEAAEIGRLAGEQEAALRALIAADTADAADGATASGDLDLRTLLTHEASTSVSVVTPAGPVLLPGHEAQEMTAVVLAALDNVRRHCGGTARAWVLVDDEGEAVTVTIRDDGPGIPPGRLELAAADGRLGVSHAIRGRMRDLGGSACVTSTPGTGTEVRLRLPRAPRAGVG
jgi:signal transduction histidine kinase